MTQKAKKGLGHCAPMLLPKNQTHNLRICRSLPDQTQIWMKLLPFLDHYKLVISPLAFLLQQYQKWRISYYLLSHIIEGSTWINFLFLFVEGYTATDIMARYKRMRGVNVLHPIAWDAFGLPAEQYAIQTGTHPALTTNKNIDRFREQLQSLGKHVIVPAQLSDSLHVGCKVFDLRFLDINIAWKNACSIWK